MFLKQNVIESELGEITSNITSIMPNEDIETFINCESNIQVCADKDEIIYDSFCSATFRR